MSVKSIIIFILVIVAMFALGWVSFQKSDSEANIKIHTQEIKEDTGKAIQQGKEMIDDAKDALDEATGDDDADGAQETPTKPSNSAADVSSTDVLPGTTRTYSGQE